MELLAFIFSLMSVILTVRNNKYCWPVGIIGIIFFSVVFYKYQLWGNFILQFIFIIQSIIGWYKWNDKEKLNPDWLRKKSILFLFPIVYAITLLFVIKFEGSLPFIDSMTTSLSIFAMFLISIKKIEGWIFWIISDIIFIIMFFESNLLLLTIVYLIFLGLATSGLIKWIELKNESDKKI